MNRVTQRVLTTLAIIPALGAAVAFNASEAEAASIAQCPVAPFIPVVCVANNVAGVQEGAAAAMDQPVVDFLGAADSINNGPAGACRGTAIYPAGVTRVTQSTNTVPLNTSAYPAGSAAGWYFEPASPLVALRVQCF